MERSNTKRIGNRLWTQYTLFLLFTSVSHITYASEPAISENLNNSSGGKLAESIPVKTVERMTVFGEPLRYQPKVLPHAYSYLDEAQLAKVASPLALSEYLNDSPGVFIQGGQNFSQDERISIRGFGAQSSFGIRGIQILVDDIPHTLPDGQSQIDGLELHNLASIEVLKGPNSALYGNSSGGVINIRTQQSDSDELKVKLSKGSFDTHQAYLYANKNLDALNLDNVNIGVSAKRTKKAGYRDHSQFETTMLNGHADWQVTPQWLLRFNSQWLDSPEAQDPGGLTQAQSQLNPESARDKNVEYQAGEQVKQIKNTLSSQYHVDEDNSVNLQLYHYDKDFSNSLPFEHGGQVELARQFFGANLQYATSLPLLFNDMQLIVGANFQQQDDFRQRYDNHSGGLRGELTLAQQELIDSSALYSQLTTNLTTHWLLNAGVRYEHDSVEVVDEFLSDNNQSGDKSWNNTSVNLGTSYQFVFGDVIYTNFSQSFQLPTTTELANPNTASYQSGGGFNPDLEPENANNYEIGYRGLFSEEQVYDIAVFYIDVTDALTPFYNDDPDNETTFFQNAGHLVRQGVELSTQHQLTDTFSLRNQYSYSDFSFKDFTTPQGDFSNKQQPGVPKHKASSGLSYQTDTGLSVNADLLYVGKRYVDNANSQSATSYWLTNLGASKTMEFDDVSFKLSFTVYNLFNQYYDDNIRINAYGGRYYEPGPEQQFMFTLAATL
ncbi:TonB-dependent receptor [Shewanella sp. UCD-KL12]|uniref:TonB-dependent receptor n=1 Tax=Shewanella sp. UCD-KL12 TaxID=1917163 RepID=UPI0009F820D4|nr:TonB-dependent receptor [Shewanella sp. UCD-KL12]